MLIATRKLLSTVDIHMECPQCHHAIRPRQIDTQYQFITIVRSHILCPDYVLWLFQFNSIGKFPDKNTKNYTTTSILTASQRSASHLLVNHASLSK